MRFRAVLSTLATAALLPTAAPASATPSGAPAPETAATLAARYDAIQGPRVGAEIRLDGPLVVGRATLRPLPGTRVHSLGDGARPCGVLIAGPAQWSYRVEDRFSVPVARRNLREAAGLDVALRDGALEIAAELAGAAVWGDGLAGEAENPAAAGAPLPEWVARALSLQFGTNPARDLLLARDQGDAGFRWALLDTGRETLVLDVDPRPGTIRVENLSALRKTDPRWTREPGRLVSVELASQPIGRAWGEATGNDYASTEVELDLDQPADELVSISSRTKIVAERDGLATLHFHLLDHTFDGRGRRRDLELETVEVDGAPADHVRRGASLLVRLPRALARGESAELAVRTRGELLFRPEGDSYWMLGLGAWYPKPGIGGEERATFRIRVGARPPFVPIAPGREVERTSGAERNVVRTELAGPLSMIAVLAGRYSSVAQEHEGLRVEVASYAFDKGDEASLVGNNVLSIRACLENWLARPYPFPDLKVVEVNSWGWGQAPAGLIFLTREQFLNAASSRVGHRTRRMARATAQGAGSRLAHEVAHGWFPHLVRLRSPEDSWLSESVADYVAAVCVERMTADPELARRAFEQNLVEWKKFTDFLGDGASLLLAEFLAGTDANAEARYHLLYGKGPWVLHALRAEVARRAGDVGTGDRLFFTWFRSIVAHGARRPLSTADVVDLLEKLTSSDWDAWFERYVYGTEVPGLEGETPRK
jgi:hypothetical protein